MSRFLTLAGLGLHPFKHRHKGIVVLRAYFDETNTHKDSDWLMLSGLGGPEELWSRLERSWSELLDLYRKPYFHASECEEGSGIYGDLSRPLRESFFVGAANVIATYKPVHFTACIMRAWWSNFVKHHPHQTLFPDPYHLIFELCLQHISSWSFKFADSEPVALIFSLQNEYQEGAERIFELAKREVSSVRRRLVSLSFASMKDFGALQAADLVAYEAKRLEDAQHKPPFRPAMQIFLDADLKKYSFGGREDYSILERLLAIDAREKRSGGASSASRSS